MWLERAHFHAELGVYSHSDSDNNSFQTAHKMTEWSLSKSCAKTCLLNAWCPREPKRTAVGWILEFFLLLWKIRGSKSYPGLWDLVGIQSQLIDIIEVCAQGTRSEDSVNGSLLKDLLVEGMLENNSTRGSFTLQQKPNRKLLPDWMEGFTVS